MPVRRILVVGLMAAAILVPGRSHGHPTGGSCDGTWSAPASCEFSFRGIPIHLEGRAFVAEGTAEVRVRVEVEILEGAEPVVLAECSASGPGEAACAEDVGIGTTVDERWAQFHLRCVVDGFAESGTYACKSALGF